jgi:hypothetical protein
VVADHGPHLLQLCNPINNIYKRLRSDVLSKQSSGCSQANRSRERQWGLNRNVWSELTRYKRGSTEMAVFTRRNPLAHRVC